MIKVNNLCLSFNEKVVYKNFNLEIIDKVTCLMGENGIGKTCLLHILAGIKEYDGGEVISDFKKPAMLFQEDRLLPWLSVLDNVMLVSNKTKALQCLKEVSLIDRINDYPSVLSGGMKRRVAIARVLAYEGDLLLLDEPFKGVDDNSKKMIIELLKKQNKPIIMVTHNKEEAEALNAKIINL